MPSLVQHSAASTEQKCRFMFLATRNHSSCTYFCTFHRVIRKCSGSCAKLRAAGNKPQVLQAAGLSLAKGGKGLVH